MYKIQWSISFLPRYFLFFSVYLFAQEYLAVITQYLERNKQNENLVLGTIHFLRGRGGWWDLGGGHRKKNGLEGRGGGHLKK